MMRDATAKEIFLAATEISDPAQRDAFLGESCGGNEGLRHEVESLLKVHFEQDSLLDRQRIDPRISSPENLDDVPTPVVPFTERPGSQIGPFKLLEQIGEGGMGVVYMAEQQRPVRRKVALKIIKPGMDTKQVIARFEAERQALAMMDHPNIAHVLDAGSTDSRRPYFVMELVRGIPITEYCDKNKLNTHERLKLFISVCQAVQHAHTKGIIHRDLKPSNVLVTLHDGVPVPKIIDFGVAKATNQQLTERTLFTSFAQMVGTPLYMSPEQAEMSGLDVDTRSDIYSLGVLLYELLTGTTPFDRNRIHTAAYDEVRRIIREEEPDKPSTRVSTMGESSVTVSARRATDPKKLKQMLRGELDWIVMKSLEKDRTRRYETASGLVADVMRYLKGEPVEACPPSTAYRVRKYIQRHKAPVGVAAGIVTLLMLSSIISWVLYAAAHRARNEALEAANLAREAQQAADANSQRANKEKSRAESEQSRADTHAQELKQRLYDYNIIKAAAAHRDQHLEMASQLLDDCLEGQRGWEWRYLQRLTGIDSTVNLSGETIIDFALAPDRQHVLGVDVQGTVRLYNKAKWSEMWSATTKIEVGMGSVFSPNGELVAVVGVFPAKNLGVGNVSGVLKVFETRSGNVKWEASNPDELFIQPVFSPDGRRLAVGVGRIESSSGGVQLRNVADGTVLWSTPLRRPVGLATFHPQGEFVYVADLTPRSTSSGSTLSCLAIADGQEVWTHERNNSSLVAISADGKELVGGGPRQSLLICDAHTGEKKTAILGPSSDLALYVEFSPDGKRLLTVGTTMQANVWDWTAKRVHRSFGVLTDSPFAVRFTPDGRQLAYVSGPGKPLQFLSIDPVPPALELVGHADVVGDVAFRSMHEVISTGPDGTLRFWNSQTGQEIRSIAIGAATYSLDCSAEGGRLATGSADGVKTWDVASGKMLRHWRDIGPSSWVKFSRPGTRLAVVSNNGELKVWDTDSGRELHFSKVEGRLDGLALSPDGQRAVILTSQGAEIAVWNLEHNQRTVFRPATAGQTARCVEFTPDGKAVAAGIGRAIELWDLGTQKNLATLQGHNANVQSLAFNADGSRLFTGDMEGSIGVWNVDTRARLLTISAHNGAVGALAISTSGETVASSGADGLVKLWEASPIPDDVVEQRRIVRQATGIVNQRFEQSSSVRDVLEALTRDKTLDKQVLSVALAVTNVRGDVPQATRVYRGRQQTGDRNAFSIRKNLDEARKSLIDAIESASDPNQVSSGGASQTLSPGQWHTNANRLVDASNVRPEEIVALLTGITEPWSTRHPFPYVRGIAHTRLGQWREVETDLTLALSLVDEKSALWHEYAYRLAFLRAYLGQWDRYASLCQKALADFKDTDNLNLAERTAKMCVFASQIHVDVAQAGALADRSTTMGVPPATLVPYVKMAKGIVDLRRENYASAIESLEAATDGLRASTFTSAAVCVATVKLYLAIAYQRVGRHDDARESLAAGRQALEKVTTPNSAVWNDWMNAQVVLPEAQAVVQP